MNNDNFDPLKLIQKSGAEEEKPVEDKAELLDEKRTSVAFAIVIWALIGIIILSSLYALLVHPIDKLNTMLWVCGNCEIKIFAVSGYGMGNAYVKLDGDFVEVSVGNGSSSYYELDGDKIYTYTDRNGEWERVDTGLSEIPIGTGGGASISLDKLLDRKNYERVEGSMFEYRAKDEYLGGLRNVSFKRVDGKYQLVGTIENGYFDISLAFIFDRIGMTGVTPPWKE